MKLKDKLDAIQAELSAMWQENLGQGVGGHTDEARAKELQKQYADICESVAGKAYFIALDKCGQQVIQWVQAVKDINEAKARADKLEADCDVLKHTRDLLGSVEV